MPSLSSTAPAVHAAGNVASNGPVELQFECGKKIKLSQKTLCQNLPAFKRFLSTTMKSCQNRRVVDMSKLGVSYDEFVLVLHRVFPMPILTPEEEWNLRKKCGLLALDDAILGQESSEQVKDQIEGDWLVAPQGNERRNDADLASDASAGVGRGSASGHALSRKRSSALDATNDADGPVQAPPAAAAAGADGLHDAMTIDDQASDAAIGGLLDGASTAKSAGTKRPRTDTGTGHELVAEAGEGDGMAMAEGDNVPNNASSMLLDAVGTHHVATVARPLRSYFAPPMRNIYDVLDFFWVPRVDPKFIELYFRQNLKSVLTPFPEKPAMELISLMNSSETCTRDEPSIIDLHDNAGVSRVRNPVDLMWPDDVLTLHPYQLELKQKEPVRSLDNARYTIGLLDSTGKRHKNGFRDNWAIGTLIDKLVEKRPFASRDPGMRFVLAGGSVHNALTASQRPHLRPGETAKASAEATFRDYDLFLILPHILSLPPEKQELEVHECCQLAIERVYSEIQDRTDPDIPLGDRLYLQCIQRSEFAITFYVSRQCSEKCVEDMIPIQIVGWYSSVSQLLQSCDISCCQVALDRGRFYGTKRAATALATGMNVVNINDLSPQYVYRLGKYFGRGMGIAVPLDRKYGHQKKPEDRNPNDNNGAKFCSSDKFTEMKKPQYAMSSLLAFFDKYLIEKTRAAYQIYDNYERQVAAAGASEATKQAANQELRQVRQAAHAAYMEKTTILERVILMALKRQQNDCLSVCPRGEKVYDQPACDAAHSRRHYPVHRLQSSETFPSPPDDQTRLPLSGEISTNINMSLPIVNRYMEANDIGCCHAASARQSGRWRENQGGWESRGFFSARPNPLLERMETRRAALSFEEGTSCGATLSGKSADVAFATYCRVLKSQNRERVTIVGLRLTHILRPESGNVRDVVEGEDDSIVRIPLPRNWTDTIAHFQHETEWPLQVVPKHLQGPFRLKHRDGKGSFLKREPAEVIASKQWGSRNIHPPVNEEMREKLLLPELE
ncbi:unnamed protein product [Amoebophrya sp. A25]|nr:unnamed protein product [Amoebophrya sp. A25]|eukprot:GSA25T00013354001.1